ncbi:MAG TPA: urea ABC transporter permease subunit UrtB, partial [Dongiaceae bacterium]|nr:urea ABC transporter permease subunit UrtB [Dongiaceae bacterium]
MRLSAASKLLGIVLTLLLWAASPAAHADSFDDAGVLLAGKYPEIEQGVALLAASGNPAAASALQALGAGRLLIGQDKALFIEAEDGSLASARNGAKIEGDRPAGLKPIKVNNRIRRAIEAAMGQLTLLSSDPEQRRRAADSLFDNPDPAQLAALEGALGQESDPAIKLVLEQARAAILLAGPGTSDDDKLAAIEILAARGDQKAKVLLEATAINGSTTVADAANAALKAIDRSLALWSAVQSVYYGVSLGSVLLLAAIGLAITFGVMGVINMAHGEMVMLGAYTTFVVQEIIRTTAPGLFDYSLLIATPLAFLVSGLAGVAIERSIIRFLYGRPLETLLATFGLSLVLQQTVRSIFGPTNREVGNPGWMSGSVDLGGLALTYNRLWIIVFSITVFALL